MLDLSASTIMIHGRWCTFSESWTLASKHFLNIHMCIRHMCIRLSIVLAIFKWISPSSQLYTHNTHVHQILKALSLPSSGESLQFPYIHVDLMVTNLVNGKLYFIHNWVWLSSTATITSINMCIENIILSWMILTAVCRFWCHLPLERTNVFFLQTCRLFNACCHVEACKCPSASHASFVWSLSDQVVEWVDLTILKLTANQPSNVASRQQVDCGRWDPLNYFKIVICPIFRGIILQQRQYARARSREGNGW